MINEIAQTVGVSEDQANNVVEEFLLRLHKMEYEGGEMYGLIETIWPMISIRSLFHLLGFLESWSDRTNWETGYMHEYLMRIAPNQNWDEIELDTEGWKRFLDED